MMGPKVMKRNLYSKHNKMEDGLMKSMIVLFKHSNSMERIGTRFTNMLGLGQALKRAHMLRNTLIS